MIQQRRTGKGNLRRLRQMSRPRASKPASESGAQGFWTRSKKVGAVVFSLIVAWAVPYFAPGIVGAAKKVVDSEPFAVTVLEVGAYDSVAFGEGALVIPKPLGEVKAARLLLDDHKFRKWGIAAGGVDATQSTYRLVLHGKSSNKVMIQELKVEVQRRDPPFVGLVAVDDSGGTMDVRHVSVDLETGQVDWRDDEDNSIHPQVLWISDKEDEVIDIAAFTEAYSQNEYGCDCRWRIKLVYTVGDSQPREKIVEPSGGGMFRTTATSRAAIWNVSAQACDDAPGFPRLCDVDPSTESGNSSTRATQK